VRPIPADTVAVIGKTFASLLDDTRRVVSKATGINSGRREGSARHRDRPVFLDAGGTPMGASARRQSAIAATEAYDIGMLCNRPALGGSYEDDSTVTLLQDRTKQLAAENGRLREEVRRLEGHLRRLQWQCHDFIDPLMSHTADIDDRIRTIAAQVARSNKPSPRDPTDAVTPVMDPAGSGTASTAAPGSFHEDAQKTAPAGPFHPAPVRASPSERSPAANDIQDPPSPSRAHRNDALAGAYDQFKRDGFKMLWHAAHLVFSREFESETAAVSDGDATHDGAIGRFQEAFRTEFADAIGNAETLRERLAACEAPLRESYIANCIQSKVRTNTGVLELLGEYRAARDVTRFSLGTNLLGEGRIMPLLPLFGQMPRLQSLDLSNNGLRNRALQGLCAALSGHPAIRDIDVSGNPFSRAGGKALLQLVASNRRIVVARCDHTQMEISLRDRILDAARRNASGIAADEGAASAPADAVDAGGDHRDSD